MGGIINSPQLDGSLIWMDRDEHLEIRALELKEKLLRVMDGTFWTPVKDSEDA